MTAPTTTKALAFVAGSVKGEIDGFPATFTPGNLTAFESVTAEYAQGQVDGNNQKTDQWLAPVLANHGAHRVLDAGCGVGQMVARLVERGYDAHGIDLLENVKYWVALDRDRNRFAVVAPERLELPYPDASFDAVCSFGVIEHVGTSDGNADRLPDYHAIRRQWSLELLRVVKPGGFLLLAGPNSRFPVDTSHGPDCEAWPIERLSFAKLGITLHRPWGRNFLWSYGDVARYFVGQPVDIEGLSVEGFLYFSRVPAPFGRLADLYVRKMPRSLLKTGLNPWVMAKITRRGGGNAL